MRPSIETSALSEPKISLRTTDTAGSTRWGKRAAGLYDADYARHYRQVDEEIRHGGLVSYFAAWLGAACDSFGGEIVALDLGCGTGRYFHALRHVRALVGIDVSAAMLEHAKRPVEAGAIRASEVQLVRGDFLTVTLPREHFDLVYSVGVLGEHAPFDGVVASRVHGWLRPGGRFAFTGVHRESFSLPRTAVRRVAERAVAWLPRLLGAPLRRRLLADGLYVDEEYIRGVLQSSGFTVESLTRHESDVHLHCLCIARKMSR
jgi:SAM-dependent methyltransferase